MEEIAGILKGPGQGIDKTLEIPKTAEEENEKWIDIYCQNAIDPDYFSKRWITLTGLKVNPDFFKDMKSSSIPQSKNSNTNKYIGSPITLPEIIKKNQHILLTGSSGTGKSTELKLLSNRLFNHNIKTENIYFPIYINLKEHRPFLYKCIEKYNRINLSQLVGQTVATLLYQKKIDSALEECNLIETLTIKQQLSMEEIFEKIFKETSVWFEEEGSKNNNVLLLLDGLNELEDSVINSVIKGLAPIFHKQCKVVITCRDNMAWAINQNPNLNIPRYELQELSDGQIILYLSHFMSTESHAFFKEEVCKDNRTHSMAKNPFLLSLNSRKK